MPLSLSEEIINKFNLAPNSYYPDIENPYKSKTVESENVERTAEDRLRAKVINRTPKGWYGVSFGSPTPTIWFAALDYLFDKLNEIEPGWELYQCTIKYGHLKLYVGNVSEGTQKEIRILWEVMSDEKLIY